MSSLSKPETRSNTVEEENGGSGASLPEDQVLEVLTRVPLDDLAACRAVSTRWRSITYEPAFAPLHCRRAAAVSGYFLDNAAFVSMHADSPAISLDFLPPGNVSLEAVAAHRGLACCVDLDNPRRPIYYVCKPVTRQWRALPNLRVRFRTAGMAMVAQPCSDAGAKAEFKIVRFSIPKKYDHNYFYFRSEVFDSRRFAWHRGPDVPHLSVTLTPAVHADGAMHWLRWGKPDVFAFDIHSEEWWLIALPRQVVEGHYTLRKLSAVAGRLCLLATKMWEELEEVWEMANYEEGRWVKKVTTSLESLCAQEGTILVRDLYSSDVGFLDGSYKAIWYDFVRGKKVAVVRTDQIHVGQVFKFESDMTPCQIGNFKAMPSSSSSSAFQ